MLRGPALLLLGLLPLTALAADDFSEWGSLHINQIQSPVSIVVLLTALSFVPFMVIALTTFTRNIVVLSLPRLFAAIDADPGIVGAGVVYIDADFNADHKGTGTRRKRYGNTAAEDNDPADHCSGA